MVSPKLFQSTIRQQLSTFQTFLSLFILRYPLSRAFYCCSFLLSFLFYCYFFQSDFAAITTNHINSVACNVVLFPTCAVWGFWVSHCSSWWCWLGWAARVLSWWHPGWRNSTCLEQVALITRAQEHKRGIVKPHRHT